MLPQIEPGCVVDDEKFDSTFDTIDKNRDNMIEKEEMLEFIKAVLDVDTAKQFV